MKAYGRYEYLLNVISYLGEIERQENLKAKDVKNAFKYDNKIKKPN